MMAGKRNPYEDILHLPHHKASNRPQMSLHDRAAQFSPFAALSGFDGVIAETGRLTGRRKALTEEEKERLNRKLALIADRLREGDHPLVAVTFLFPTPSRTEASTWNMRAGCAKSTRLREWCSSWRKTAVPGAKPSP